MDELFATGIGSLLIKGTGWTLFVCSLLISYWLVQHIAKLNQALLDYHKEVASERTILQEKRIEETRSTLDILHDAALANLKLAEVLEERAGTLEEIKYELTSIRKMLAQSHE